MAAQSYWTLAGTWTRCRIQSIVLTGVLIHQEAFILVTLDTTLLKHFFILTSGLVATWGVNHWSVCKNIWHMCEKSSNPRLMFQTSPTRLPTKSQSEDVFGNADNSHLSLFLPAGWWSLCHLWLDAWSLLSFSQTSLAGLFFFFIMRFSYCPFSCLRLQTTKLLFLWRAVVCPVIYLLHLYNLKQSNTTALL